MLQENWSPRFFRKLYATLVALAAVKENDDVLLTQCAKSIGVDKDNFLKHYAVNSMGMNMENYFKRLTGYLDKFYAQAKENTLDLGEEEEGLLGE